MRHIAYLRVSTDEQNLGIEAQRNACREYCRKNGFTIANEFIDEGLTGALPPEKRPGLLAALEELKKGDILLVAKRDRIARCKKAVCLIEMATERKKTRIISTADEGTWESDENDPMAFMMRSMADTFAQFERLTIKSRTKAALAVKKAKGERVGRVPFGYKLAMDGIHLEVCEKEKDIINQINELQTQGLTIRAIAKEMNNRNILNRGNIWSKSSVHRILKAA